jgi:DNA-binding transcriptional LysR family regulator
MLLAQLEAFAEVARLGKVSLAAGTLSVTQPALTARLQALESELRTQLFVRSARGMALTDAGRTLLPYAHRTIAQVLEGAKAIEDLTSGTAGTLFIAAAPAVSTYLLPGVLKSFQHAYPNVRLGVRTGHTEEVLDMVLRREVHVGVGRPIRNPEATLTPVFDDELVLVTGASHAFARRGSVHLRELADDRLILFDRASSYYELTSSLLRQAGVVPEGVIELDNVEAAKQMVMQGLGVALLPRMSLRAELRARALRAVRLIGAPPVRRPIVAIRRRDAGPPMGPVAGFLRTLEDLRGPASRGARARA